MGVLLEVTILNGDLEQVTKFSLIWNYYVEFLFTSSESKTISPNGEDNSLWIIDIWLLDRREMQKTGKHSSKMHIPHLPIVSCCRSGGSPSRGVVLLCKGGGEVVLSRGASPAGRGGSPSFHGWRGIPTPWKEHRTSDQEGTWTPPCERQTSVKTLHSVVGGNNNNNTTTCIRTYY